LVSRTGRVQNRLLTLDRSYGESELVQAENYLNQLLNDLTLEEARAKISAEMEAQQKALSQLEERALALGSKAVQVEARDPGARAAERDPRFHPPSRRTGFAARGTDARPRPRQDPRALPRPRREGAASLGSRQGAGRGGAHHLHRGGKRDLRSGAEHRRRPLPERRPDRRRARRDRTYPHGLLAGDPSRRIHGPRGRTGARPAGRLNGAPAALQEVRNE